MRFLLGFLRSPPASRRKVLAGCANANRGRVPGAAGATSGRRGGTAVRAAIALTILTGSFIAPARGNELQPLATTRDAAESIAGDRVMPFRCRSVAGQAAAIRDGFEDGSLAAMPDAALVTLVAQMNPDALVVFARIAIGQEQSYEYRMFRRERVNGRWPARPDHMVVRYQDKPRRVYAKWLADGAHAGQEVIYDEARDPNHFVAHFGGVWHFLSGSFPIDGAFARMQSRHTVRDLGLQFIVRTLDHDARSFTAENLSAKPSRIDILNVRGMRLLALTWDAPSGPPAHFAAHVRLMFDLHHPWPRAVRAWDSNGALAETVDFEDVVSRQWTDSTFDPRNPDYGFR